MLKMIGVKLEKIIDIDMHLFIKKGLREEISCIAKRYARENNKYMKNYDPTKPSRFQMLQILTFQIFTGAKSLVPLFNKASRKAPTRIERQILGMQHLDLILVYSPGKNNPADFMSRHPSDTESSYLDKVTDELEESIIKMVKNKEKAGVSNNLKDATKKDKMMIFLKEIILQRDWEKHKKNSLINQFYSVRYNLSVIDDVIYMNDLCVPPYALRIDVVKKVHEMGHLGEKKGLKLLRQNYWWPGFSSAMKEAVIKCHEC